MSDRFSRVRPGARFEPSAEWHNTGSMVFEEFLRNRSRGGQPASKAYRPPTIKVKNTTGAELLRFDTVGLGAPLQIPPNKLEAFKLARPAFNAITPVPLEPFAVMWEPLAVDAIGDAVFHGLTVCRAVFNYEESPRLDGDPTSFAALGAGVGYGAVLWKEPGTGEMWCVVDLGGPPLSEFSVWITAAATGGGKYVGHVYTGGLSTPVSLTTDLTIADMGGMSGSVSSIAIFNTLEQGRVGHWLTDGGLPNRPIRAWWHDGGAMTDEGTPRRIAMIADPGSPDDCPTPP